MDNIISQIQTLASQTDAAGRAKIQHALQQVLLDLESPYDSLMQLYNGYTRYAIFRVGIISGLFRSLAQSQSPLSVEQLAKQSGASPQLFERIIRYLASNNLIEEIGQGQFRANRITHYLGSASAEGFSNVSYNFIDLAVKALPEFLDETGFADITNSSRTPFQKVLNTNLSWFAWLADHPDKKEEFQQAMKSSQGGDWMAGFDEFEQGALEAKCSSERVFFVDVAGGSGHRCIGVKDKYPSLEGRLVLQDLPEVVKELPEIQGVRIEAHNIFQEQTVKGAQFYYLSRILHDWPDDKCIQILQNVRSAMVSDSRILINEIIVPETNVPWQTALADISVMVLLGGRERTRTQWATLAERSGLRISHVHGYNTVTLESVLVLELDPEFRPVLRFDHEQGVNRE
ncbi:O-methyltransferase-domain-containing protein [Aspergillus falconensis]